jgi:hypothetical protein
VRVVGLTTSPPALPAVAELAFPRRAGNEAHRQRIDAGIGQGLAVIVGLRLGPNVVRGGLGFALQATSS